MLDENLKNLKIEIPIAPSPVGAYVAFKIFGKLFFISGQLTIDIKGKIIKVKLEANIAYFFIELTDKQGDLFGFEWILQKVTIDGIYKDCWMTTSVSQPIPIAKST